MGVCIYSFGAHDSSVVVRVLDPLLVSGLNPKAGSLAVGLRDHQRCPLKSQESL